MRVVNYFGLKLLIRVIALLVVSVLLGFTLARKEWLFSQLVLGGAWFLIALEINRFVHQSNNRIARFIAGIRYDELETAAYNYEEDKAFSGMELAMSNLTQELIQHKHADEHQSGMLNAVLANHPYGLLIYDDEGIVHYHNAKFVQITGTPHVKKLDQIQVHWPELLEKINRLSDIEHRFSLPTKSGGKQVSFTQYERKIKEVSYRFLEANESNAHKGDDAEQWLNLIKVVNHEIRNGITPMISLSESLLDRVKDIPNEQDQKVFLKSLTTIKNQANYLSDFSDSYRRIIQIPAPKKENLVWLDVMDEVVDAHKNQLQCVDFQLLGEVWQDVVKADKIQLIQVFTNLLVNALSAIDEVEQPVISVEIERGKLEYLVRFSDNGIGIPSEERSTIFIPFVSNREKGSGIGLAVCKKILQNHGGRIWLDSNQNATTFIFSLPAV